MVIKSNIVMMKSVQKCQCLLQKLAYGDHSINTNLLLNTIICIVAILSLAHLPLFNSEFLGSKGCAVHITVSICHSVEGSFLQILDTVIGRMDGKKNRRRGREGGWKGEGMK